jgi:Tfp pilus assembly ATPase PilU
MAALDALLRPMLDKSGSDLHLTVGLPPALHACAQLPIA